MRKSLFVMACAALLTWAAGGLRRPKPRRGSRARRRTLACSPAGVPEHRPRKQPLAAGLALLHRTAEASSNRRSPPTGRRSRPGPPSRAWTRVRTSSSRHHHPGPPSRARSPCRSGPGGAVPVPLQNHVSGREGAGAGHQARGPGQPGGFRERHLPALQLGGSACHRQQARSDSRPRNRRPGARPPGDIRRKALLLRVRPCQTLREVAEDALVRMEVTSSSRRSSTRAAPQGQKTTTCETRRGRGAPRHGGPGEEQRGPPGRPDERNRSGLGHPRRGFGGRDPFRPTRQT